MMFWHADANVFCVYNETTKSCSLDPESEAAKWSECIDAWPQEAEQCPPGVVTPPSWTSGAFWRDRISEILCELVLVLVGVTGTLQGIVSQSRSLLMCFLCMEHSPKEAGSRVHAFRHHQTKCTA
jgi:hypothetical protein